MTTYIDSTKIRFDEQGSAPATPDAGKWVLYAKSTGLFVKDDTGTETQLGAGGSFTVTGDSGSQTVSSGDTLDVEGGSSTVTSVVATDKVIVDHAWNYETVLVATGAFDITLSSLTGYSSCRTIEIDFCIRGTVSATTDNVRITFNSDTTDANYYLQRTGADNAVSTDAGEGATATALAVVAANTAPSNSFASGRIVIFNPLSAQNKNALITWMGLYDTAAMRVDDVGLTWKNTASITSIQIRTDNHPTDTFAIGSFVRVRFIR